MEVRKIIFNIEVTYFLHKILGYIEIFVQYLNYTFAK